MKKYCFAFLVLLFFVPAAKAQKIDGLLKKAFMVADSSDYYFKKAKKSIVTEKDQAEYFFCKNAWHSDRGNVDSTEFYGRKAEAKFIKLKAWLKLMYVYHNMGKAYNPNGEYEKAIAVYQKGLKVAEAQHDAFWAGNFNQAIAISYHDFEDFRKGVFYGKKAFLIFVNAQKTKKADHFDIAGALNAIAINFDDWNKPDSALAYHYKVFDYVKGKDTIYLGSTYNNIGNTLLKQKKYREAKKWIEISLYIGKANQANRIEKERWYDLSTNYNNLAIIAFNLGDNAKAGQYFAQSYEAATKAKSVEKMRDYYYGQYLFNKHRNNLAEAIAFQDQYIVLRDSVFDLERAGKMANLEAKYQTEKKEKELLQSKAEIAENEATIKKKNSQFIVLALIVIALVIIIWLVYRQQKLRHRQLAQEHELKTAIAQIETQSQLQNQRLEISRDLHDNIGAQLTFIISSVDNIKYAFDLANTKLDEKLQNISDFAKDTIVELRDTIWAMNNNDISFEDLRARILNFIEKAKEANGDIVFSFAIDDSLNATRLTSVQGMNVYRSIQEAVNNALKYADAKQLSIAITKDVRGIVVTIEDDGRGFDQSNVKFGNGIANMRNRISAIGGEFRIDAIPGNGTKIAMALGHLNQSS
jgi:signal transduction histidine kinase